MSTKTTTKKDVFQEISITPKNLISGLIYGQVSDS